VSLIASEPDNNGVINFSGVANWAFAGRHSAVVLPHDPNPDGLVTIYSNLGNKTDLFVDNVGWDVAGPDSGVQQEWVAMPFTPTFDATVTQISIAVEHNSGSPNSFVLSLNAGDGRLPGKAIKSWVIHDTPEFGTCCAIDVAKAKKGVAVTKGQQYWVVASLNASEDATRMEWNISSRAMEEFFSFNKGDGWGGFTASDSAFAVYGKRAE
jgi:hypothetical protein